MTPVLVHACACILNITTKEELHSCLHNTTSKGFNFTCGVALTGYSVVTYNVENMEMVVNSVETHKLNATDKELPIQFLQFDIIITMKVCGLVYYH